ncbi:hypothetical protein K7711_08260 [Nocardia sp. CA2R105]|uniref:hypothetical protein n=1 Tax=Nocardia coffeae TaxID=2873381 RepID=UPI001CA7488D|nr:hypothetical protein [Nocardia coffeae]MBY8856466.1 hypothetical protein [Nocardia coffeae]
MSTVIDEIRGTAIALEDDDIDTDRIIPAKYLKDETFVALGEHVFETDRLYAADAGTLHPFTDPARRSARILLAAANFGCGSSREHAPQALRRWGIEAIVAVSFGEIFRDNAATIGLPCLTADPADLAEARRLVADAPGRAVTLGLAQSGLHVGDLRLPVRLNEALRQRFLTGRWDSLSVLSESADVVRTVAAGLPYLTDFAGGGAL